MVIICFNGWLILGDKFESILSNSLPNPYYASKEKVNIEYRSYCSKHSKIGNDSIITTYEFIGQRTAEGIVIDNGVMSFKSSSKRCKISFPKDRGYL